MFIVGSSFQSNEQLRRASFKHWYYWTPHIVCLVFCFFVHSQLTNFCRIIFVRCSQDSAGSLCPLRAHNTPSLSLNRHTLIVNKSIHIYTTGKACHQRLPFFAATGSRHHPLRSSSRSAQKLRQEHGRPRRRKVHLHTSTCSCCIISMPIYWPTLPIRHQRHHWKFQQMNVNLVYWWPLTRLAQSSFALIHICSGHLVSTSSFEESAVHYMPQSQSSLQVNFVPCVIFYCHLESVPNAALLNKNHNHWHFAVGIDRVGLDGTMYDQVLDFIYYLGLAPKRFQVDTDSRGWDTYKKLVCNTVQSCLMLERPRNVYSILSTND